MPSSLRMAPAPIMWKTAVQDWQMALIECVLIGVAQKQVEDVHRQLAFFHGYAV